MDREWLSRTSWSFMDRELIKDGWLRGSWQLDLDLIFEKEHLEFYVSRVDPRWMDLVVEKGDLVK